MMFGLALALFTTVTFFTKEKIVDLGVLEVVQKHPHNINWSPFAGLAVMVFGAFLILMARRKNF